MRTVEAGSFAGAAKKLGITSVAVSQNVQRLERQLGVRLLQRSTRKLSLTEEGRTFYERCAAPLRELEGAEAAVTERGRSPMGALKVTCLSPFGRTYVLPLIPAFSRRYPGIELELHLDDTVSDMIAGGYDIGIRAGEARDGTMVMREVAPLYFVVCGAPSYLAERGVPLSVADLAKHNCLRLRSRGSPNSIPWRLGPKGRADTPSISGNFLANDVPALVTTAVHGQGLVFCSASFCPSVFSNGCAQAGLAGMHRAARPHLYPLREPQACSSPPEGVREFHAGESSRKYRSDIGPTRIAGSVC